MSSSRNVSVMLLGEEGMGGVVDVDEVGEVGTKWMRVSAMEDQFMIDKISLTSFGKFFG